MGQNGIGHTLGPFYVYSGGSYRHFGKERRANDHKRVGAAFLDKKYK